MVDVKVRLTVDSSKNPNCNALLRSRFQLALDEETTVCLQMILLLILFLFFLTFCDSMDNRHTHHHIMWEVGSSILLEFQAHTKWMNALSNLGLFLSIYY